jgi:5-hydroxyisourate hydrolase
MPVTLSHRGTDRRWTIVGRGTTGADGRIRELAEGGIAFGEYRIEFDTAHYFQEQGVTEFYSEIAVVFTVSDSHEHYHIPLLLSPYGYSTYKGT